MRSIRSRLRVTLAGQLRGRVLDCGSGEDLFGPYLRRNGNDVVSLDLDEKEVRRTPGQRVVASCAEIPFADNAFDAVWSCAIIEHVREDTLPEMIRVTRRGGRVIAITPNHHSPLDSMKRVLGLYTWDSTPGHVRLYHLKELEFYGQVMGETLVLPFMGRFFRRFPRLAHVWILDIRVTRRLKELAQKERPRVRPAALEASR
ncbi:MAG: class I SAM-dependent methyltransferase [Planctomycetes bacterium]|nr:class I SAM-dependent methyltransferase [Planctomycetota bacterium]